MKTTLTIRLDDALDRALTRVAKRTGKPRDELAREALRRQFALASFNEARRVVQPFAQAHGLLIDKNAFNELQPVDASADGLPDLAAFRARIRATGMPTSRLVIEARRKFRT